MNKVKKTLVEKSEELNMKVKSCIQIKIPNDAVKIKQLNKINIPIKATIHKIIDINIMGNISIVIENNIADILVNAELTAINSLIPDGVLSLKRSKNAIKELVVERVIQPLRENDLLIESEFTIDDEIIDL